MIIHHGYTPCVVAHTPHALSSGNYSMCGTLISLVQLYTFICGSTFLHSYYPLLSSFLFFLPQILMSDFLFPASRLVKEARENPDTGQYL